MVNLENMHLGKTARKLFLKLTDQSEHKLIKVF